MTYGDTQVTKPLKAYIETYGCQMNTYDSELVLSILSSGGYEVTEGVGEADIILLNTCSVRENAHLRIYGRLQELKHEKDRRPGRLTIGILGCMAQSMREELLDTHPELDFIAGPDSYRDLPELIETTRAGGKRGKALQLSRTETYSGVTPLRGDGVNGWIAVMRGCDNMCTFCIVPFARGRERSRDPVGVVAEAEALADAGYKQVTLLGQNVNSYQYGDTGFAGLVERVAAIEGLRRVRFTAPHPKDFPKALIDLIASHPKVCNHIHLPLQAGNDRILEMMKRTYTGEMFTALVDTIRDRVPGIAITTDIIVGFPTETESEFKDTFALMERVGFDAAFIFKYSERAGTYAAKHFDDDVTPEAKTDRIVALIELQQRISGEKNQQLIGSEVEVLAEEVSKKDITLLSGRTDTHKTTLLPKNGFDVGDLIRVEVVKAQGGTLYGRALRHDTVQR
jgi:tRNA-2-methylthio-N6-dimethylallyladenosine synthase